MRDVTTTGRQDIQEAQYEFPYHYIPRLQGRAGARLTRALGWGFEYLCYQYHIVEKVLDLRPVSVLEVGCGDGHFIGALGAQVHEKMGADFSEQAIRFAKAFHPDVHFHDGDARDIDRQFDVVVAIEVLEHIPDEEVSAFLRMLFDLTRPGGHVVISVPSVVLPINRKHFRHYSSELLQTQVQQAWELAELEKIEHVCHIPRWMAWYNKLTVNRYWTLEIGVLSNFMWRLLWGRHRIADPATGRHVIGIFKKAV